MLERSQRRQYYSSRVGSRINVKHDLETAKRLFLATFEDLERDGYFEHAFGNSCDRSFGRHGTFGRDIGVEFLRRTRKDNLWPFTSTIDDFEEEDLFDVIEVLHDAVARPDVSTRTTCEEWFCQGHFTAFDTPAGKQRLRDELNPVLEHYGAGYHLTEDGEIAELADAGLQRLEDAPLPASVDQDNVAAKVAEATRRFRRYHASVADRHAAVRTLADVLEYLRPQVKRMLTKKDEADLFELANRYAIRHNNTDQKTNYDKDIWYRWAFYYYLATIHASTRLIDKAERYSRQLPSPAGDDPEH